MVSLLPLLGTQMEQTQIAGARIRFKDAREALVAYAIIDGRRPCPATSASAGLKAAAGGAGPATNSSRRAP
jgi:hypothetical protein